MRWVVVAVLCLSIFPVRGPGRAIAASTMQPDPCGFRATAWPYVQFSATLIGKANKVITEEANFNSAGARFYKQGLRDAILDIGADFGWPHGWQDVRYRVGRVMQDLVAMLEEWESGQTGWIMPDRHPTKEGIAEPDQVKAWHAIQSICPNGGKPITPSPLIRAYDSGDFTLATRLFPKRWRVTYNFDCRAASVLNRHFILTVRSGQNALVATIANEVGTKGSGSQIMTKVDSFSLKVQSGCYWHVKAGVI